MHSLIDRVEALCASSELKPIYKAFLDISKKHGILERLSKGLALGFSGGPDSVMLLLLLIKYRSEKNIKAPMLAIHVNHSIRGDSADADASFSRELCDALGVECSIVRVDAPALAARLGVGMEEAARSARYSAFEGIISGRKDIQSIFLAHNATDNVETVMLNMLRGSGIKGMCGIPPVRDFYYRPLLAVEKNDILSALDKYEIPYAVDETNDTDDYTRNYVRHNLLPHIGAVNPSYASAISRMTDNMRDAYSLVYSMATPVLEAIGTSETFAVEYLRGLHSSVLADVLSRLAYERIGIYPEEGHIKAIEAQIEKDNFTVSLVRADLVCQRGICFFDLRDKKCVDDVIFELKSGENKIQGTNVTVFLEIGPNFMEFSPNIYNYSIYADLDGGIIDNGVYLRFKRDGDSYRYGGITRRLKKVFNDRGIPPFMRDDIPVICDNDGILWVVGLGIRDGASAKSGDNTLRITVLFDNSDGRRLFTARNFND